MSGTGTKFLASTLLAFNLLPGAFAPVTAAAQTVPNARQTITRFVNDRGLDQDAAAPPQQPPAPTQAPESATRSDAELRVELRRKQVNDALREAAQNDFRRMTKLARDGYAKDLDRQESSLTRYLAKSHNTERPNAVILDPNAFDTGLALGMTPELTTERMLGLKRVTVTTDQISGIANRMKSGDPSKFAADGSFTQSPSAHYNLTSMDPQACVIVPESAHNAQAPVPRLSYQENLDYSNLHEGWHCKNTRFSFHGIPQDAVDGVNPFLPQNSIGNEEQMKALVATNKMESLSDVGAVGDMIRKGKGLDLLDRIQQYRYGEPEDYIHWTAQPLEGLRQKINEMGIARFRSLNDADARKLYEEAVDKNAYTPGVAEIIFAYRRVSSDEDRAAIRDWQPNFATMERLMSAGAAVHDGAGMKTLDDAIGGAASPQIKTALTTLRDQINEIGLDRFRNLTQDDGLKIAQALHDSGAAPSDIGSNAAAYWLLSPADRKTADATMAQFKLDVPTALAMMKPYGEPPTDAEKAAANNANPQAALPLTPAEQKVFDDLAKWDAAKLLQDGAFAKEGKITPATLIHTYGKMQDDLRGQLKTHPDDPLLRAKATKLQQAFITTVQELDYVDANAQRGVNIFNKEPGLKKALDSKTPAPDATPDDSKSPETPKAQIPQAARRPPAPGV